MSTPAQSTEILFIGNSFIYCGSFAPVAGYNKSNVTDLNNGSHSGVAGIFQRFTAKAGLSYNVNVELIGGSDLQRHYDTKLNWSKAWDTVVMQITAR